MEMKLSISESCMCFEIIWKESRKFEKTESSNRVPSKTDKTRAHNYLFT